jgi:hypothetical protein
MMGLMHGGQNPSWKMEATKGQEFQHLSMAFHYLFFVLSIL